MMEKDIPYANISVHPFYSYIELLTKYLIKLKPKKVIEFGSGLSTYIIASICIKAIVITYESSLFWYSFYYLNTKINPKKFPNLQYVYSKHMPIFELPDIVFLDGYDRQNILNLLYHLNFKGILILHDCFRYNFSQWELIEENNNTAILRLNR